MPFSFITEYSEALWLLLLLPLVILMARKGGNGAVVRRSARRLSICLRLLIVTLLVLSIAQLEIITPSDKSATVFLLDASDSIGTAGRNQELEFTRRALQTMQDNQGAGVVLFGQNAQVARLVTKNKDFVEPLVGPLPGYTNLAEAVRVGAALVPGQTTGRLVVMSDGIQNLDEVRDAARVAAANGVAIDVVPLKASTNPETSVSNLQVPASLRQGEEFNLKVSVESNRAGPARLQILQDGQPISDKPVQLQVGLNFFEQQITAKVKGPINYTARIQTANDTLSQNNEGQTYSLVKGKPKTLLVEGHPDQHEAANLQAALDKSEIETDVIPPASFPASKELLQYDAVMLVNVPARLLGDTNMKNLQAYVKESGKGLVMVGGEESYGLGGYLKTPVEEMLPVELQLPSEKRTPTVAMVLVIDRSGSMLESQLDFNRKSTRSKLEIAKDAAVLATKQLGPNDQLGVVVFDTQGRWQVPLGPLDDPAEVQGLIGRIGPGGGTSIYSGLAPAIEALKGVQATSKHIIVLTDGQDIRRVSYDSLIQDANESRITISTIGLGYDVNGTFLGDLAERGGGRYLPVKDPNELPSVFVKEAQMAARSYIIEQSFVPTLADSSAITKRLTAMPELKGYVATKSKATATTALTTNRQEPLLAHWQYGLGRVAAWTSDAKGRWASDWLEWPDFPRFWSQLVRWTVAENEAGGLQVQTHMIGDRLQIQADALNSDSQYLNGLQVQAQVATAAGVAQGDVALVQTAPGHYEGYYTPKSPGSFAVNVQGQGTVAGGPGVTPAEVKLSQKVGAVAPYSPEYRQLGDNEPLLREIASMTGGRVLSNPAEAFRDTPAALKTRTALWPWFLLLAVLLFPLDIAIRRTPLSPRAIYRGYREYRRDRREVARNQARFVPISPVNAGTSETQTTDEQVLTQAEPGQAEVVNEETGPELEIVICPASTPAAYANPASTFNPKGGKAELAQAQAILRDEIPSGPAQTNAPLLDQTAEPRPPWSEN